MATQEPDDTDRDGTPGSFSGRALTLSAIAAAVLGAILGFGLARANTAADPLPAPGASSTAPAVTLALGEAGNAPSGSTITVLTWGLGAPGWSPDPEGFRYSRAVVRFCSGQGVWNFRIREIPRLFTLMDAGGETINPVLEYSRAEDELIAEDVGLLSPGECVTGSIVYLAEEGREIRSVRFTGNSTFDWDVSAIGDGSTPAPSVSFEPGTSTPQASPAP